MFDLTLLSTLLKSVKLLKAICFWLPKPKMWLPPHIHTDWSRYLTRSQMTTTVTLLCLTSDIIIGLILIISFNICTQEHWGLLSVPAKLKTNLTLLFITSLLIFPFIDTWQKMAITCNDWNQPVPTFCVLHQ